MGKFDFLTKDGKFLTKKELDRLSADNLENFSEGIAPSSVIESKLGLEKGALGQFAEEEEKKGINPYRTWGIGKPFGENRWRVRLSVFSQVYGKIKDRLNQYAAAQTGDIKVKKVNKNKDFEWHYDQGGIYFLKDISDLLPFHHRKVVYQYKKIKAEEEQADMREKMGVFQLPGGHYFYVDIRIFGDWLLENFDA